MTDNDLKNTKWHTGLKLSGDNLTIKLGSAQPIKTIFVPYFNGLLYTMNPELPDDYEDVNDRESTSYKPGNTELKMGHRVFLVNVYAGTNIDYTQNLKCASNAILDGPLECDTIASRVTIEITG